MDSDAVHIWSVNVEGGERAASRFAPLLSPEEQARAEQYKSISRAAQFVTGRGCLRLILSEITGIPATDLRIAANENGKPVLVHETLDLHFNVAHSQDIVLIAVTSAGPVGVDVEAPRTIANLEQIARRWLSDSDLTYLMGAETDANPHDRIARFIHLWTRKEALFKAWGSGLSWETARSVSVLPDQIDPSSGAVVELLTAAGGKNRSWTIRSWSPLPGYAAAVAAPGDSWRVRFETFSFPKSALADCSRCEGD